jgi:hypothetical protein
MKEILHIVPDDKFIDGFRFIDDFLIGYHSIFLVKVQAQDQNFRYLKYENKIIWKRKELQTSTFDFNNYDAICFHTINPFVVFLLNKIPAKLKIFWFYWSSKNFFLKISTGFIKKELVLLKPR